MPKNVGKYQQGSIMTHPAKEPVPQGEAKRAAPAGPVPRSPDLPPLEHKAAPNNDGHKV